MKNNTIHFIGNIEMELTPILSTNYWFNWLIVTICLILIIIGRHSNFSYIGDLFTKKTPLASLKKISSISLILNYLLISSLFIWQFISLLKQIDNSTILLTSIFFGSIIILFLKLLTILSIDKIFERTNHFHINNHLIFFQISGLVLVPLYVLSFYLPPNYKLNFYIFTGIIFSFILIIRELKSLFTALKNRISFFYIILYLCTLEILPVLITIKIIIDLNR